MNRWQAYSGAHQRDSRCSRSAARRGVVRSAITVLAGKGSLRRAIARPCLLRAVLAS